MTGEPGVKQRDGNKRNRGSHFHQEFLYQQGDGKGWHHQEGVGKETTPKDTAKWQILVRLSLYSNKGMRRGRFPKLYQDQKCCLHVQNAGDGQPRYCDNYLKGSLLEMAVLGQGRPSPNSCSLPDLRGQLEAEAGLL